MISTDQIDGWFNYAPAYDRLVSEVPQNGTFVECGAWLGKSSSYLADIIARKRPDISLYIVDSWLGSSAEITTAHKLATETDIYNIFLDNMKGRSFTPVRKLSLEAAHDFKDSSLDVVFIDMSHEYQDVKDDLAAWFPKVKTNGYIAGHDWSWPGVSQAVAEQFAHNRHNLFSLPGDCWVYHKQGDSNE